MRHDGRDDLAEKHGRTEQEEGHHVVLWPEVFVDPENLVYEKRGAVVKNLKADRQNEDQEDVPLEGPDDQFLDEGAFPGVPSTDKPRELTFAEEPYLVGVLFVLKVLDQLGHHFEVNWNVLHSFDERGHPGKEEVLEPSRASPRCFARRELLDILVSVFTYRLKV